MDKISRRTYKDWLWISALIIMVICFIEGFIYYFDTENKFLMVLLNIQNAIKAYKIDPDIKIKDAFAFMNDHSGNIFICIVSYIYSLAVIIAPFCTIAALALLISAPFRYLKGTANRHKKEVFLIIGNGATKKKFIKNAPDSNYRVYTIEQETLDDKTKIDYLSKGIKVIQKYSDRSFDSVFSKINMERVNNVLLCEEEALSNLVILKEIEKHFKLDSEGQIKTKVYITCSDEGSGNLIKNYYDGIVKSQNIKDEKTKETEAASKETLTYDLYIVDLKKNAVCNMFTKHPIHEYNTKLIEKTGVISKDSFDVHMGILGFGEFGQKTLIEAMNLSVLSPDSKIVFDVFDVNMKKVIGSFLKQFSPAVLDELKTGDGLNTPYKSFVISNAQADSKFRTDGVCTINFWDVDADALEFTKIFADCNEKMPFTYIMVALDNEKRMASSVIEVDRLIGSFDEERVMPSIIIRTKEKGEIFTIIDNDHKYILPFQEKDNVYSFTHIQNTDIIDGAKKFHYRYNQLADVVYAFSEKVGKEDKEAYIKLLNDNEGTILADKMNSIIVNGDDKQIDAKWLKADSYKRESSVAQSKHQVVKSWLYGADNTKLQQIFAKAGAEYHTKKYKERLEHRRWNLYIITRGYSYFNKRDDKKLQHDCLSDFEALIENRPDTLEYDNTPYVLLSKKL